MNTESKTDEELIRKHYFKFAYAGIFGYILFLICKQFEWYEIGCIFATITPSFIPTYLISIRYVNSQENKTMLAIGGLAILLLIGAIMLILHTPPPQTDNLTFWDIGRIFLKIAITLFIFVKFKILPLPPRRN